MSTYKFSSEPCLWFNWSRGSCFGPIKSPSGEKCFVQSIVAFSSPIITPESESFPMPFPNSVTPTDHLIQMQMQVGRR